MKRKVALTIFVLLIISLANNFSIPQNAPNSVPKTYARRTRHVADAAVPCRRMMEHVWPDR